MNTDITINKGDKNVVINMIKILIINSRIKWLVLNFFVSLIVLLLIEGLKIDVFNPLYLAYSIWVLAVYIILTFSELRYPGLNILSILFVGAIISIAYPSFICAIDLINGNKVIYDDRYDISDFLFHTAAALNVYFSLFFLLITYFTNKKFFVIDTHKLSKRFNLFYMCIVVYVLATILRLFPILELVSSILALLASSLPMLVLLLLALYCGYSPKRDKHYKLFVFLVTFEVFFTMFFGFYKSFVIRAALMYLLYYYVHCRTIGKKLISIQSVFVASLFLVFMLYIVYPFITIKRFETGFGANSIVSELPDVDNLDILRRVLIFDYPSNMLGGDDNSSALNDRLSSVGPSAFFYKDAYYNGFHTDMIRHSMQVMIPRVLYPNKPGGSTGAMAVSYVRSGGFDPYTDSAESLGVFASAYFFGGWPATIFMCLINAIVISLLLKTCFSHLENLFSWLIIFFLFFSFLMCFKESADGGYAKDVLYVIYAIIIFITSKLFIRKKKLRKVFINGKVK